MKLKRRKFTQDFKLQTVRELQAGKSVAEVARANEVHPAQLSKWSQEVRQNPTRAFTRQGRGTADEVRVAELERMVGQQAMEISLLKKALARLEEQRSWRSATGGSGCSN